MKKIIENKLTKDELQIELKKIITQTYKLKTLNKKQENELRNKLKSLYGVKKLYSWSKISTFIDDRWSYYLKYVLRPRPEPDLPENAYSVLGKVAHKNMQDFYEKNITNKTMVKKFLKEFDLLPFKDNLFNRVDEVSNEKIGNTYKECCIHYFNNCKKEEGNTQCEKFFPLVIYDELKDNYIVLICYIDFLNLNKIDNNYIITINDYKTSTKFSNAMVEEKKGQLQVYGMAVKNCFENANFDNVKLNWNFIKYTTVECELVKGTSKPRHILRNQIGESLASNIKTWCKNLGYTEKERDNFINIAIIENSIDSLPNDIKSKFKFKDCLIEAPFNEIEIDNLQKELIAKVRLCERLENEYKKTKNEMLFWQDVKPTDEYRLACLSSYSPILHKPYQAYLENKAIFEKVNKDEDEDFDKLFV